MSNRSLIKQFQQLKGSETFFSTIVTAYGEQAGRDYASGSFVITSGTNTITCPASLEDGELGNYIIVDSGSAAGVYEMTAVSGTTATVSPTPTGTDGTASGRKHYYQNSEDDLNYIRNILVDITGEASWNDAPASDIATLVADLATISGSLQTQIDGKASYLFGSNTFSGTGDIYAGAYYGDGSNLSGITATVSGSDHSTLANLDYASASHTGFQPAGDYATNTDLATVSGMADTNATNITTLDTKIDTTSGTLQDQIDEITPDSFKTWTDGITNIVAVADDTMTITGEGDVTLYLDDGAQSITISGSKDLTNVSVSSGPYDVSSFERLFVDTTASGFTINFPSQPNVIDGDLIEIVDLGATFDTNNLTCAGSFIRNGQRFSEYKSSVTLYQEAGVYRFVASSVVGGETQWIYELPSAVELAPYIMSSTPYNSPGNDHIGIAMGGNIQINLPDQTTVGVNTRIRISDLTGVTGRTVTVADANNNMAIAGNSSTSLGSIAFTDIPGLVVEAVVGPTGTWNIVEHYHDIQVLDTKIDTTSGTLQTELDATQTGAGLDADGGYTPDGSADYISSATSLKNADSLLDDQIKANADAIATTSGSWDSDIIWEVVDTPTQQIRPKVAHITKAFYHGGSITIAGDLTVSGTTTTIHSEELTVTDKMITVNATESGSGITGDPEAGIEVDRGSETNYLFVFDETQDNFRVGISGSTQAVATREDSPNDGYVAVWNDSQKRFDTTTAIDDLATDAELSTTSGTLQTQIDVKDNYVSWSFAVDGVTKDAVTSADILNFVGGDNITITRSAEDEITISGGAGSSDHSLLSNLDYASAGHTGFASSSALSTASGVLQTEINSIETAAGLDADGTFTAHSGTNYIDSGTTMFGVDELLDTQIKINADNIATLSGTQVSQSDLTTLSGALADDITALDIFKTVSDGTNTTTASGNEDTLTFYGSGGLGVVVDEVSQSVTISGAPTTSVEEANMSYNGGTWEYDGDFVSLPTLDLYYNGVKQKDGDADYYTTTISGGILKIDFAFTTYSDDWVNLQYEQTISTARGLLRDWLVKTAAYMSVRGDRIMVDTSVASAFTINLPDSPGQGDTVIFLDAGGNCGTTNVTIGRNGKNIMGSASDLVIDTNNASFELVYYNASRGWVLYE